MLTQPFPLAGKYTQQPCRKERSPAWALMSHQDSTQEIRNRRAGCTCWSCHKLAVRVPIKQDGLAALQNGKQTRAVILPDNSAIVLYRTTDDEVYCSDANSTAYKFPMIDANIIESEHPG